MKREKTKEIPAILYTKADRKEDFVYGIVVVATCVFIIIGFVWKPLFSSVKTNFEIPVEWQEQMVSNGILIEECRKKIDVARTDSQRILDEILVLNEITKVPGIIYELKREGVKWRLYRRKQ